MFIDNYSRFCWFYPLKLKSDFTHTFTVFQDMVENQYQTKIGSFQCDGGGEFTSRKLTDHLQQCGIKQLISCPYTSQQNGLAERKHRHIIELGLSMMFQSTRPQKFWVEAFYTASFLINLLPTTALDEKYSPYEKLHGKPPEYSALRVFGCACYPTLRDYASNKFDPRSLKCVFLGYNDKYKGYRCFLPSTGRVYISRHVIFDETVFPFAQSHSRPNSGSLTPLMLAWTKGINTVSKPQPKSDDSLFTSEDFPPLPTRETPILPIPIPRPTVVPAVEEERSYGCTAGLDHVPIGNNFSSSSHSPGIAEETSDQSTERILDQLSTTTTQNESQEEMLPS